MYSIYLIAGLVIAAYILQILLGLRQLKNFNQAYMQMRRQGRVAIGRRSGKLRAGTIVLFAVDKNGTVLDGRKMQGVTVLSKFKAMPSYIGQDIHYLDTYNPLVRSENRLLQIAIEDAREVFLRVEAGNYDDKMVASAFDLSTNWQLLKARFKCGIK
ncbi:transcriptional regulator GutM [Streptococcus sp. DD13]|uniref:transcriptional regulator GutM n=1 Tax=Streptococcus sp. DD13 TaxID=1777881 RepID=UPI00079C16BC|nr:transcriptional regulator GutM [Streptococcus sp. DD13]KXT77477.1 Glucitol operon activator protein [Streptococcus sp. DD13]